MPLRKKIDLDALRALVIRDRGKVHQSVYVQEQGIRPLLTSLALLLMEAL